MPDQSLIELLTGYAAAPFEYFGYGKRPPPRVGDAAVRSPVGFGFEDPEARAFAPRSQAPIPISDMGGFGGDAFPRDAHLRDQASYALAGTPLGVVGMGAAGANMIKEGINTADRWLSATHQLPGAKPTDTLVAPTGTEDYQINPNRVEEHDLLAPLGLASMGNPVSALGRESLRAGAKVGRPSESTPLQRLYGLDAQIASARGDTAHQLRAERDRLAQEIHDPGQTKYRFGGDDLDRPDVSGSWYHWSQSPARFEAFDDAKLGTGEGDMLMGAGVYLDSNPSTPGAARGEAGHLRQLQTSVRNVFKWGEQPIPDQVIREMQQKFPGADFDPIEPTITVKMAKPFAEAMQRAGYDAADWKAGDGHVERVVYDKSNLTLLADQQRSSLPGAVGNALDQGATGASRAVEKVTPAFRHDGSLDVDRLLTPERRTLYHGTPRMWEGDFDISKRGMSKPTGGYVDGMHLSPEPRLARGAAAGHPLGGVIEFEDLTKKPFIWDRTNQAETTKRIKEIFPEYNGKDIVEAEQVKSWTEALRRNGYDSVHVYDDGMVTEIGVVDPSKTLQRRGDRSSGAADAADARTLYHGSAQQRDELKVSSSKESFGPGVYLAPSRKGAETYANMAAHHETFLNNNPSGGHVHEVTVDKPLLLLDWHDIKGTQDRVRAIMPNAVVTKDALDAGHIRSTLLTDEFIDRLQKQGYAGVEYAKSPVGEHQVVVYDPSNLNVGAQRRGDRSSGAADAAEPLKSDGTLYSDAKGRGSAVANVANANRPRIENPIKAYHGSPHDFDKFDSSKIGTGEGAQAFGHGLYFAESQGVAKSYQDSLTGGGQNGGLRVNGAHIDRPKGYYGQHAFDAIVQNNGNVETAIKSIQKFDDAEKIGNVIRMWEKEGPIDVSQGRLYEVSLHAKPEEFLDWDLPLSKQSEGVRKALEPLIKEAQSGTFNAPQRNGLKGFLDGDLSKGDIDSFMGALARARAGENKTDRSVASNALREAGITGIRYKDQGSRGKEGGTYNYVVFPGAEDVIEIIGKDGKPLQGAEKAKAVKELYANQGMPVPGQEDERDARRQNGFGGPIPQQGPKGFGGPVPQ